MKKLLNILNESIDNNYEKFLFYKNFLDEDELVDIFLLHHSKLHVNSSVLENIPFLDKIFKKLKNKSICNVSLYRGLYHERIDEFKIGEIYTFDRYKSFSENLNIAKNFSNLNSKFILKIDPPITNGFPLYKVAIDNLLQLKNNDIETFTNNDGEYSIKSYTTESEWIFNIGKSIIIKKISLNKDGYTIIESTDYN